MTEVLVKGRQNSMKITVIGPGAMGLLFGGKLAACADVSLIGSNAANLEKINKEGFPHTWRAPAQSRWTW